MTAPMGCRWCGTEQRGHGQRRTPNTIWHTWAEPDRQQICDRLRARLEATRARYSWPETGTR